MNSVVADAAPWESVSRVFVYEVLRGLRARLNCGRPKRLLDK